MYGLVVTAGIFISTWFAEKELLNEKKEVEILWNALLWILIFGIIGARLFHVIDLWSYYSQNLILIPQIYRGGLGIFGGIIGGSLGLIVFCVKNKFSLAETLEFFDLVALSLPLGQFVGRWANYFNQELFGLPTKLPWAIFIPTFKRPEGFTKDHTFHPLFLYESIASLLIFFILFALKHKLQNKIKLLPGDLFLVYLFLYSLLRLALEPLRITHFVFYGFNVVSSISLIFAIFSLIILIKRK